jgi:hypothetical protein
MGKASTYWFFKQYAFCCHIFVEILQTGINLKIKQSRFQMAANAARLGQTQPHLWQAILTDI